MRTEKLLRAEFNVWYLLQISIFVQSSDLFTIWYSIEIIWINFTIFSKALVLQLGKNVWSLNG